MDPFTLYVAVTVGKVCCGYVISQGCKYALCKTVKHLSTEEKTGKRRSKCIKVTWTLTSLMFGNIMEVGDLFYDVSGNAHRSAKAAMSVAAAGIAEETSQRVLEWKPEELTYVKDHVIAALNMDGKDDLTFENMGDRAYLHMAQKLHLPY